MPWDPVCVLDLLLRERITQFDLDLGFLSPGGAVLQNIEDVSPAVDVESVLELGEIAPPDSREDDCCARKLLSATNRFARCGGSGIPVKASVHGALEGRKPCLHCLLRSIRGLQVLIAVNAVGTILSVAIAAS